MEKEPLISILTVVFNQRPYIDQSISSVLSQTYQHWEWIILDDGSSDGTGEVIKKLHDIRIHYTSQRHAGSHSLTESCNKALSMCRGEFVALLDGDDYWPEDKLEIQVKSFDRDDVVLSYGECCIVNPMGKKIDYLGLPEDRSIAYNDPIGSSLKMFFKRYCFMAVATVMVRRSALVGIGGFIEAKGLFQDFTTWTRLSLEGKFAPLPCCLGFYRRHPMSASWNRNAEELYCSGIDYLRKFIVTYEGKLDSLGFDYDLKSFEKQWQEMINEFVFYLPYNRAVAMLRIGSFKEAMSEFRKFIEKSPSFKTRVIYYLVIFSALLKADIVSPLSALNQTILQYLKVFKKRLS
jgi:glycosyltransferase involved in cell wall biosynthesis